MKRILVASAMALLTSSLLTAGLFKNSVDLADLGGVEPEALEGLRGTEFNVFLAQVGLSSAKAAERRAAGALKTANRVLTAEELDLKAARAEAKAAKANIKAGIGEEQRQQEASAEIASAELHLKSTKKLVAWKEQEQKTREAEIKAAKAKVDLAEASRDLARLELLIAQNHPSAAKYDLSELRKAVQTRQRELDKTSREVSERAAKLATAQAEWEALAQNIVLPESEEEDEEEPE